MNELGQCELLAYGYCYLFFTAVPDSTPGLASPSLAIITATTALTIPAELTTTVPTPTLQVAPASPQPTPVQPAKEWFTSYYCSSCGTQQN